MKHKHENLTFIDPVCGMELSQKAAVEECTHDGKLYYFCSALCKDTFEADPEKYAAQHHRREDTRP